MATPAYLGKPYTGQPQAIPGTIKAVHYDRGGEGVAYHDFDKSNPGSGGLNKGDTPNDKFRIEECVGISYTKPDLDKWMDGDAPLPIGDLYMGWTAPGEWVNYSVHVARAGKYKIKAQVSSALQDAQIRFWFDGADNTGIITVPTTTHWHTWKVLELGTVDLHAGPQVMRLEFVKEGNMNVMWLEFTPV